MASPVEPDPPRQNVGANLRKHRRLAGLSQQDLADRADFSREYVAQIESGKRIAGKHSTILRLANALEVSPTDLTGQPYAPTSPADLERFQVVPRVRLALDDHEPDDGPLRVRPLPELELAVDRAMAARMDCNVPVLGENLPPALTELRHLWFTTGDRAAAKLLVKAAFTAALALKAAGFLDLGIRLSDLAYNVASTDGDPVSLAAARFAVAQCALTAGNRRRSTRIAETGANELDELVRRTGGMPKNILNEVFAMMGALNLHAALSASGEPGGDPQSHLSAAAAIARRVTGNPWRMEITPANVDVWRVAVALESDEPDLAPQLASRVNVAQLLTNQRRSRCYLDAGHGAFNAGDLPTAVHFLTLADRAAPGDLRQRPSARAIVEHLVHDGKAPRGEDLQRLAVNVGIRPA